LLGLNSIRLDSSALSFTFAIAILAGMLFGLAPSWQAARSEQTDALKRTDDQARGFHLRARGILVVVEIALAFILLTGAGLLLRSLARLTATPVGINAENILTARLSIPPGSTNLDGITNFFGQLKDRVAAQPGVVAAALSSCHPLAGRCAS